ncbi:hypothetical protein ACTVNX_24195 [Serratia nevei]|uniref:hypothetical protein n=1 Tax=Serratia nevei TaxID=2703794 RepID=UPI0018D7107A|nr:hypothetical protein [Serratia marcescens]MBI6128970.1 hypothetical protein [Serratia marcescens]
MNYPPEFYLAAAALFKLLTQLACIACHQTQIPTPKITAASATPLGVASPLPSFRLPRRDHLLLGFTVSFLVGGILHHATASESCSVMTVTYNQFLIKHSLLDNQFLIILISTTGNTAIATRE